MSNRRVVLPGVLLGVLLLALAAAFTIGLPKATGETSAIALPATLPGGYAATDVESTYKNAPDATDDQIAQSAAAERSARSYGDKALSGAHIEGATRTYVSDDFQKFMVVQAARAGGGALMPFVFTNPAGEQAGTQVQRLVGKAGAQCIEYGQADGQGGLQVGYSTCQKSEHGMTVQVTGQSSLTDIVDLADVVLARLA